jgi:hypothetical protein
MNKMLEETGKNLFDLWPNLEVYFHGGVNFDRTVNNTKNTAQKILNTTKYTMPLKVFCHSGFKFSSDLLLMLDYGIFYEFIPMDTFGTWNKKYSIS